MANPTNAAPETVKHQWVPDLTFAEHLADRGRFGEAAEICEVSLREDGPSARAFHLLGLIRDGAGDRHQASEFYRKALFLEPDHYEALMHLALIKDQNGDRTAAENLKKRAHACFGANEMTADLRARNLEFTRSGKLNDCWNKIGVWGNRECGELKKVTHCRNCIVYSSAAAQLLGAELPEGYLDRWTTHFATPPIVEDRQVRTALILRIGAELLALSPSCLQEIAEGRPIHSVPQRRSSFLLGVANIRGELLICVALDRLLGLENKQPEKSAFATLAYRRLVVASRKVQDLYFRWMKCMASTGLIRKT